VKSALILAAVCAALCVSAPAAQAVGPKDSELFCKFFPLTTKCSPAKPAAVVKAAPVKVAAVKPAAVATPKLGVKVMSCVKAPADKPYLYSCVWK
jgi:hypothetical protein